MIYISSFDIIHISDEDVFIEEKIRQMSNWTHVAGVIRVDYIKWNEDTPELDFDKLFGKECGYDYEGFEDADKHPELYLPMGSEGSLQKSVWINPNDSHAARYTVSIFGDLRDHDSCDEIIEWFKNKCQLIGNVRCGIRQATITVDNEYNGIKSYTWNCDDNNELDDEFMIEITDEGADIY